MKAPSRRDGSKAHITTCADCGCLSSLRWAGWSAHRVDDPEAGDAPELAFFCPACAASAFGRRVD